MNKQERAVSDRENKNNKHTSKARWRDRKWDGLNTIPTERIMMLTVWYVVFFDGFADIRADSALPGSFIFTVQMYCSDSLL